jgi:hypothetical protein
MHHNHLHVWPVSHDLLLRSLSLRPSDLATTISRHTFSLEMQNPRSEVFRKCSDNGLSVKMKIQYKESQARNLKSKSNANSVVHLDVGLWIGSWDGIYRLGVSRSGEVFWQWDALQHLESHPQTVPQTAPNLVFGGRDLFVPRLGYVTPLPCPPNAHPK